MNSAILIASNDDLEGLALGVADGSIDQATNKKFFADRVVTARQLKAHGTAVIEQKVAARLGVSQDTLLASTGGHFDAFMDALAHVQSPGAG